jgi:arginyl-tRNA synthetase
MQAAKRAGWLPEDESKYPKVKHVGFGLVLGTDGKRFRTRSSEVVRLVDLLDEAKSRSKQGLVDRGREGEWTPEELEDASEALGYGAIKYYLSHIVFHAILVRLSIHLKGKFLFGSLFAGMRI